MSHAADTGLLAHIRAWFEKDVEPDLEALKADAERFREALPAIQSLAGVVVTIAKAADPAIAPEVAAAVQIAVEAAEVVARIVAELGVAGI